MAYQLLVSLSGPDATFLGSCLWRPWDEFAPEAMMVFDSKTDKPSLRFNRAAMAMA
ncbi:MAG: hypothetical protein ACFB9M_02140 [Myxococcota bacterium]